ncbi:MAG: SDR family NAD(P)-dependent oxidoreductase, partial [Spirochaetales bacterium]|nr:SDR family NAD(P)-dependent oxidoreductase [Spirochaetales bacterium]
MAATILQQFALEGRAAVVTGAGTGLGEAMAVGLAEAGADILAVYHTHAPKRARAEIEGLGRRFVALQADLSNIEPVDRIVAAAVEAFGSLDILVNDAGIIRRAPSLEFTEKDW